MTVNKHLFFLSFHLFSFSTSLSHFVKLLRPPPSSPQQRLKKDELPVSWGIAWAALNQSQLTLLTLHWFCFLFLYLISQYLIVLLCVHLWRIARLHREPVITTANHAVTRTHQDTRGNKKNLKHAWGEKKTLPLTLPLSLSLCSLLPLHCLGAAADRIGTRARMLVQCAWVY